eukprot:jgi/Astpho2/2316/e_gw1.00043.1.1_t
MASNSDTGSVFTQVSPAVLIERRGSTFAFIRWTLSNFAALGRLAKQQTPWVQVGKHDCRLLLYPGGDTQALPGYVSLYLQVSDPRSGTGRWDCFASYRLSIVNQAEVSKSIVRDSWHRFSAKKKSHGWCDFGPSSTVLDAKQGFLQDETLLVTADIQTLQESISFARDGELSGGSNLAGVGTGEVLGGKYTWKLHNFSMFRETIRTQKIMSPSFPAGECSLRLCLYQSVISGTDHLSICLESKDTEKSGTVERSCWCLFRLVLVAEGPGSQPLYRDSYGRFAADSKTGDNTSLGWNDFITMEEFSDPANGYVQDDTVTLTATFNVINESSSFGRSLDKGLPAGKARLKAKATTGDVFEGKFSWKVEQFTKLKELLKKRKITGLCIKSKRFIVGGRDCRLIVYPRGQSNPPNHLSMFLEVSDSRAGLGEDWSCFVSHKLAVMHHRGDRDRSVSKESQNRYSRAAKDWGWREFLTLTTLFDADSGYLVNDAVEFAAEVLVLRESSETRHGLSTSGQPLVSLGPDTISTATKVRFLWRIENFTSFRDIMETRKIFSKYFEAGSCDLRLGMYESFDTLCIYLESDAPAGPDHNFWVKYRIAVLNQKRPDRTVWKDSAICTKQWNNSVLQFMKVSDILDPEAGFVHKEGLSISCEVLEACPWFEFADLDVCINSEDEDAGFSTDPDEILDSDEEAALAGERDEELHRLLAKAGMQLSRAPGSDAAVLLDTSALQHALRDQQMLDRSVLTAFLGGLQVYLKDPVKIKRLLLPTVTPPSNAASAGSCISSSAHEGGIMCLLDLLMSVRALRYPLLELLLDVMLVCCQQLIMLETHALAQNFDDGSESSLAGSWGSPNAAAAGTEEGPVAAMLDSGSTSKAQAQEQADGAAAAAAEARPAVPAAASGRAELEDVLTLAVTWMRKADPFLFPTAASHGKLHGGIGKPPAAHKLGLLLSAIPVHQQPDMIMLLPKLLEPADHVLAATLLVQRMVELQARGAEAQALLRLPVLATLALLSVEGDAAKAVVAAALRMLPSMPHTELPPAVGLTLRLASNAPPEAQLQAVQAVRASLRALPPSALPSASEALRMAVSQYEAVAQATLEAITADLLHSRDVKTSELCLQGKASAEQPGPLGMADLDVLLDLLCSQHLQNAAQSLLELAATKGLVDVSMMGLVLERRRMQHLRDAGGAGSAEGAAAGGPSGAGIAGLPPVTSASLEGLADGYNILLERDFLALLSLAEMLGRSQVLQVRELTAWLYSTMFSVYEDASSRERMLLSLVQQAAAGDSAASQTLLHIVGQHEHMGPTAVALMLQQLGAQQAWAGALQQQVDALEAAQQQRSSAEQDGMAAAQAETETLRGRIAGLEDQLAQVQAVRKADSQGHQSGRKELQDRVRNLEKELDWVGAELSDARRGAQRAAREATGRVREAEEGASRARAARREDAKRAAKERAQIAERLKESESAVQRLKLEAAGLQASAAAANERAELATAGSAKQLQEAQTAARLQQSEVSRCRAYIESLETKLAGQQEYVSGLEGRLQADLARIAPLLGQGLDDLSAAQLSSLVRVHEDGARRARAMLVSHRFDFWRGESGQQTGICL